MKMRRFFAPTMSQALKQVRREQGSEAVILSQRKVEGGVEVVAAVDPEQLEEESAAAPSSNRVNRVNRDYSDHHTSYKHRPPQQEAHSLEPTQSSATGGQEMQEMRREMQAMRTMMEQHLSLVKSGSPVDGDPKQAWLMDRLSEIGIAKDICEQICLNINLEEGDSNTHWRQALQWLEQALPLGEDEVLQQGGVIALVGPTGVGKTTTAAKLAARYALRNGTSRVALVTTDAFRIGAQEQLRAFGSLIGVPVYAISEISELHETLSALSDRDLVIIDTAGLSQRDMQLLEQLAVLRTGEIHIDPYLVVSATTQEQSLDETVGIFNRIELKGAIFSKLDEGGELGGAISVLLRHQLPLLYLGDGQRVPEDLQVARGRDLVDRLVSQRRSGKEHLTVLQGGLQMKRGIQAIG